MYRPPLVVVLAIAAICPFAHAEPASSADIQRLQDEIASMRNDYEARIAGLEARLAATEAALPAQVQSIPIENAPSVTGVSGSGPSTAFNPAASLILSGTYGYLQPNPDKYQVDGFFPPPEGNTVARGFNIGESELTLSASVDPYFAGYFTAAYDPEGGVDVEEAYLRHVGLLPGGTIKFGRFLSAVGYHNEIHAHAWDFVNAPLVYQAFFDSALDEDGVQLRWLAPTVLLVEVGVEAGNGANFPGDQQNDNSPDSWLGFVHVGGDVGDSSSYLVGASYRHSRADQREYTDVDAGGTLLTNSFHGTTDLWGTEFVWKWAPHGNPLEHNLKLQGEYFYRDEHGRLTFDLDGPQELADQYDGEQSGWYVQAIYQFMARWRIGARYDALDSGNVDIGLIDSGALTAADLPLLADHDPTRISTMLDFSPSEFSRLRLQWAEAHISSSTDQQLILQYIMSLGAHGAHAF
jgi:hypothetical protein